jgi:hypothetical protein
MHWPPRVLSLLPPAGAFKLCTAELTAYARGHRYLTDQMKLAHYQGYSELARKRMTVL